MKTGTSPQRSHSALARDVFGEPLTEPEALCLMLILHACRIVLSEEAQLKNGARGFEGITSRHAAEVVASLFLSDPLRNYVHWYWKWNAEWDANRLLDNRPPELLPTLLTVRARLESHPWVARVENEDWELFPD